MSETAWMGLREVRDRIVAGERTSERVTELALARAEALGRDLRAFVSIDRDGARAAARQADAALARGDDPGPLHGVPVSIKDLIRTLRLPTTGGSRALGDEWPGERDARLVARLRRAGAVVVGKTNLNEFAYGITGANHHYGQVENPWDRERMPGGSSSGSGSAVAAGIGFASVGTDTRGSIRIPASCCGVTGFKPTAGRVPTDGVFPLSWSLDHAGPLTRSVEDAALMVRVMAGGSPSSEGPASAPEGRVEGLRLGICDHFFTTVDPEVEVAVRGAVDVLTDLGLEPVELEIPELEDALAASGVIAAAEGLAVHDDRMRERREDYDPHVLERLEAGRSVTALELARAHGVRVRLTDAYRRAFADVDLMVGPTLPGLPAPVGSAGMEVGGGRTEPIVDASCRLTAPQNLTGAPALSIPCGFSASDLPIGLQLWTGAGRDDTLLAVGQRYQQATDWHRRRPPLP